MYTHMHIWERILSLFDSNVPLPVSSPGGTLDSGPVHPHHFCSFSALGSVVTLHRVVLRYISLPCVALCDSACAFVIVLVWDDIFHNLLCPVVPPRSVSARLE